ncbi:autotransporter outer membrane beta-barrel domain-containing protein [Pseudoxanthomonas daejeonensis]|uniref:Autotransporter domain-containing esterase n=1 Tax=Pseudoxanthomonas daejeonensis TaxID=266062 RepID=A0ABQ6Z963_9GAMM|nr:autotransporter domain-containing protein [Pseudoxanthomonas daejeonensis]KAF1695392.1 autotransporter domain-containing esterase [Pseudoxanthomonas daejeonensis]
MSAPRPLRSTLAVALALAAAPALAGEFEGAVFFGDSLTDSGHFQNQLPANVRPITGKFTTNPAWVWAEYLADRYDGNGFTDNQGGDNYAQGGSRVTVQNGAAESTVSQVGRYLAANGGKANPDTLYTVWTGANDLFAVAAGAPPQATLATAVGGVVQIVGTLDAAGARYILVPSLPDMGITPNAIAAGPVAQATLTQLATTYNTSMYGALSQAGYRVIPLDTFSMLREVVASPVTYGMRNVTQTACLPPSGSSLTCNPSSLVAPDAASTYLFADGVHPSGAAHAILADYAISVLEGPQLIGVLPHSAKVIGRSRADQVAYHLPEAPAGLRWWGGVRADTQRYDHADLYDGMAPAGLFGLDWANGNGIVAGGFLGYGRMDADFGGNRGDFEQTDATFGGFLGWYGGRSWVNAQASYTSLDYDVTRDVRMGPSMRRHNGSTDGSNTAFGVNGGYDFGEGALRHGPVAGLLWQKVEVDGFSEDNLSSTALAYSDQTLDSLVGSLGWQVRYDAGSWTPYLRATWDHEFEDAQEEVFARLQTLPDQEYAVPGVDFDGDFGTVVLGARFGLFGLDADAGVRASAGQDGGSDSGVFLSLGGSF